MKNLILKSSFHEKLKVLIIPMMLLTLGVGQMWADLFPSGKYIYLKTNSEWKVDNARFAVCFQWKEGGGQADSWYSCLSAGETDIYYAVVPANYYDMFFCRMNGSNNTNSWTNVWNQSDKLSYSNNYFQKSSGWNGTVTNSKTYAPKMSSVSLADNETAILAGTGISSDPYLIATSATIKVRASGTKAVPDPDATIYYNIKDNTTSKQNSTNATYSFTASSTANTVYQMKVDGYTKVSSTSSTTNTSSTIYYKTVSVKDISVYIYVGGRTPGEINSVEMNGCTPYVGEKALPAVKINNQSAGAPKFTLSGNWLIYTFANVTKVSNITCARDGGNIFTGEITDNVYYSYDGTSLPSQCVSRDNPTWGTAPASGAVGGSMTASVSGAPTGATITWSSTNTSAATVSSSGVISYGAVGNTTIKANVSWDASGDYCAGSYELSQAISVTSGATVSAVRACPEYVSANSGQVKLDISSTGASTGWYYRVCNSTKTAYYAPDEQSAASNTLSWTMNGSLPTGPNTLVVELYNSARQLVCTSSSVTVNVEIAESVTISAGAHGSVSPSGIVYANNNHVHPSITATANTNYHFVNWTSNNAAASVADAKSATTTVTATASDYTITANFAGDQYSITYKDKGNVAYTGNNEGSLPATHTYGTATTLVNGSKTGFTFDGWYTDAACTVSAGSSIGATAKTSNFTLYAKWTENMSTLSTSNHYDAGDPGYAAPTVSGSATNVGYATTRTITATAAGTGYTFDGWTLTNCTRTDGGAAKATSITIRSNGDGAAATVVANYTEVLTSRWHLVGNSSDFPDGWNVNNTTMMQKKTGHSTESAVYFTVNVTSTDTKEFKVVDDNGASSDIWYGYSTGSTYLTWTGTSTKNVYTGDGNANNLKYTPTVVGSYEFKVDYSGTYPAVTITYPTKYTVTYSVSPTGAADAITTSPTIASGGEIAAGTSVTFTRAEANDGYTWYRWEDGSGTSLGTDNTYTTTINANTTVVAKYTAKEYTVTLDLDEDHKGTTSGATASQTVTYNAITTTVPNRPTGAEGYGLDGYYTDHNGVGTKVINGDGTWIASVPNYTDADKKWIHDGDVTLYAYYKKAEITALTLSQAIVAPNTTGITVTPTIEPTPTGTVNVRYEIQYSNGTALSPQPSKSVSNKILTFTAPAASATYRVQATLYLTSDNTELHTTYTTFQVAGDHTVTIQYKCDDAVIKASTTVTGKPLAWSDEAIEAPTITGYTFARWEAGEGVSLTDDDGTTTKTTTTSSSIKIKATYDGMLTAVYTQKDMIYFNNANVGWDQVYVYFYDNGDYWEHTSGKGIGAQYDYAINHHSPHWWHFWGAMTRIEGTDIWYFDYQEAAATINPEHASLINDYTHVAFTQDAQGYTDNEHKGYEWFYATKAAYRTDFNHNLPMYVPLNSNTVDKNVNGSAKTVYYNTGYWMNYPLNTGYTLRIYDDPYANNSTGAVKEIPFPFSNDKQMPWKSEIEFNFTGQAWFMIYRNDGQLLGKKYTMKQEYHETALDVGSDQKIEIKTSAEGVYKFTLSYLNVGTEVAPNYKYYIHVEYPVGVGDYRIKYNDRTAWSGATHDEYWWHASEIIRKNTGEDVKADTVSLYVAYGSTPSAKFQKVTAIDNNTGVVTWTDVESGTVSLSGISQKGVYNFIVSQPAGGASISLTKTEEYTGNYYIRTDCAGNTKWDNYKATDHQMTYSDYAKDHSYSDAAKRYTHYYAHWVTQGTNVKFCIANDYSQSISDTIAEDYGTTIANITSGGTLESGNANIRFMWNQSTNKINRAYISGSGGITDRFLVLEGDARMYDEGGHALTGTYQDHDQYGNYLGTDNQVILHDDENFVYERIIKVNATARAKLTAKYNENIQYFKGSAGEFADGTTVQLLGGTYAADKKYLMRIIYDFKTNRLVSAYMPEGEVSDPLAINADLMLIREHQEDAQQLIFTNDGALTSVKSVYGVMRFNRWTLNNREKTGEHPLVSDPKSPYERALYWISFPFDVNLSDVFGFGTYGVDWIIEYYDGAGRAAKGYWKDSPSFWKYVMPAERATYKLEKGKGYVLALDIDRMKSDNTDFWKNNIEQIELFFPSASTNVGSITATNVTTTVESHECTIDRTNPKGGADIDKNRTKADSHWNMIGVPSYANYGSTLTSDGSTGITWQVQWSADPYVYNLPYLYEWNTVDNTYTVQSGSTYPFKSMHSYMVQYAGDLHWSLASATPSSIVARRTYAEEPKEVEFRLELLQNDKAVDQTFVKLSEKEEVSAGFSFDEDLCKEYNDSKANIYTFIENWIPAAGNILPMGNQTTLVPVGVKAIAEDEYTFSMPDGTDGVGVTLIDNVRGMRTNLALSDYMVELEAGTYDDRFVLEISPIEQIVTGVEMINGENGDASLNGEKVTGVCKKLIDGVLYIVKDGKVFDARGARIQ